MRGVDNYTQSVSDRVQFEMCVVFGIVDRCAIKVNLLQKVPPYGDLLLNNGGSVGKLSRPSLYGGHLRCWTGSRDFFSFGICATRR